jgi:hypothetical protein
MAPIASLPEELGHGDVLSENAQTVDEVAGCVSAGRCILFLGAAAHAKPPDPKPPDPPRYRYPESERPPLASVLSAQMAAESHFLARFPDGNPADLQKVALDFEIRKSRARLIQRIREAVHNNRKPSPVLRGLADLNFPLIITTNYDQLFEQALRLKKKNPIVSVYKKNEGLARVATEDYTFGEEPRSDAPFMFKVHGDIDSPESIVVTDEDYIHFVLRMGDKLDFDPIPETIRYRLQKWPVIFLGYSLMDYNLRLLFKTLRWNMDPARRPDAYSVDRAPDPLIYDVWHNQRKYIRYIVEDVWSFVPALYRRVKGSEMPE